MLLLLSNPRMAKRKGRQKEEENIQLGPQVREGEEVRGMFGFDMVLQLFTRFGKITVQNCTLMVTGCADAYILTFHTCTEAAVVFNRERSPCRCSPWRTFLPRSTTRSFM